MSDAAVGIAYLDGPRLRASLLAAADWVDAGREELDRINVFPVPDGDTGTNFASTFRAVAEAVRKLGPAPLPLVTKAMAQTCVFSAHGNSGMLLSQFLLGFRDTMGEQETATARDVARAIRRGAERLHESLDEPVEGTILTVAREAADEAERAARDSENFVDLMTRVLNHANDVLQQTPELLAVLKEAGVVDAGAKAFVRMLEGIVRLIHGDPIVEAKVLPSYEIPNAAAFTEASSENDYQYCTEVLVSGSKFPPSTEIRSQMRELGASLVILAADEMLRIHIHTDVPEEVFALAGQWGTIESTKADDMREQHQEIVEGTRRVALVVDSGCDLPDETIDKLGIVVVPLQIIGDSETFQDRIDIRGAELYDRMSASDGVFTTSQPTPGAFASAFEDARSVAPEVIGLFFAGALSGTLASAKAAAQATGIEGITIVDSRTASVGIGMLAERAVELAEEGWPASEIAREIQRIRDQSGGMFTVDVFDNLLRSGRVSRGRAWLGGLLDIKPILDVSSDGSIVPIDRVRGRGALIPRILEHLDDRLTPRPRSLRMGVAHANAKETAERFRAELVARYAPRSCLVEDVTSAIGVHVGPGAWGVFYQVED
jgi:DegV family protein with EDD domain